jgi:hypothetical protein
MKNVYIIQGTINIRSSRIMDEPEGTLSKDRKDNSENADDLMLDFWSTVVEIDENSTGHVTHTGKGTVNFGRLRDKRFSIFSDNPTPLEDLKLVVRDLCTGEALKPEILVNEPKYKWIRVPFKYPIEKGEEFGFEAKYDQPNTFKVIGQDYYRFMSRHNCDYTLIEIRFPKNVKVIDIHGSDVRTSGGIILDIPENEGPKIITKKGRQSVIWTPKSTKIGYTYTIMWKTSRID